MDKLTLRLLVALRTVVIGATLAFGVANSAHAASFTGTPSPSLSPLFGTLINFDDKATGTAVGPTDYLSLGVLITETEGLGTFARYFSFQSSNNYIGT